MKDFVFFQSISADFLEFWRVSTRFGGFPPIWRVPADTDTRALTMTLTLTPSKTGVSVEIHDTDTGVNTSLLATSLNVEDLSNS